MFTKSKIIYVFILIVSIVLISGCLENQAKNQVTPEQIQVKDFKWIEIKQGAQSFFEIIINSDYNDEVEIVR